MKVASIATYADRLDVLIDAVASLVEQVDIVQIYWNGDLPSDSAAHDVWCKIVGGLSFDRCGRIKLTQVHDRADLSKFLAIWDYPEATIYTCDDDLIYRDDYIKNLYSNLYYDHFIAADVVSLGGKIIGDGRNFKKNQDYRTCFNRRIHCTGEVRSSRDHMDSDQFMFSTKIDVPLSGVSAFSAKKFQDCKIDDKYKFAADVQLAKWVADLDLECKRAWNFKLQMVKINEKMNGKDTIYNSYTKKQGRNLYKLVKEFAKVDS